MKQTLSEQSSGSKNIDLSQITYENLQKLPLEEALDIIEKLKAFPNILLKDYNYLHNLRTKLRKGIEEYNKYHREYYKNNKKKMNKQVQTRYATNEDVRERKKQYNYYRKKCLEDLTILNNFFP